MPSTGGDLPARPLGEMPTDAGEEVLFCDRRAKGFILPTLTPERCVADHRAASTILAKPFTVASVARFEVAAADRRLTRSAGAAR